MRVRFVVHILIGATCCYQAAVVTSVVDMATALGFAAGVHFVLALDVFRDLRDSGDL